MEEKLPRRTEKPWGYELLFALTPSYAGKLIFVKKGHRLSLQYHEKKDETMFLQEGKAILEIEVNGEMTSVTLTPGSSRYIPPGTKHRIEAIEDTVLFEVSTTELDDVVRLADDYGRTSSD
jgi:mannose-6-phosphate isomerase-like protein (cupin superfamily)